MLKNLSKYIDRFHKQLTINYSSYITEKLELFTFSFDEEKSVLRIDGKNIKITKFKDIYFVLKYLFSRENIYEECFFSEIRDYYTENIDSAKQKTDKYYYDMLYQFNKRLLKNNIDFFIIKSHLIQINNKYKNN